MRPRPPIDPHQPGEPRRPIDPHQPGEPIRPIDPHQPGEPEPPVAPPPGPPCRPGKDRQRIGRRFPGDGYVGMSCGWMRACPRPAIMAAQAPGSRD
jgi:hypothetical protein